MELALNVGYWAGAVRDDTALVQEADRLGFHSVWAAEAYGSDVVSVLAWFGAKTERIRLGTGIMQMPARTPAMTAMTAVTLDGLSGGRFICGLGVSGPQVVEGWHGVPYGKPLALTREYVSIFRSVIRREGPVQHDGQHYQIPYRGPEATGLGKPLKLIVRPSNPDIPVYLASIGPKNVALTAEIADGWLPAFFSPANAREVWGPALDEGFARSGESGKSGRFQVVPTCRAIVSDDLAAARDAVRPHIALYVGGMGAKGRNFYNDLATRYGYGEAAAIVQDHYLAGRRDAAIAAVPDGLIDETNLIGSPAQIRDRLDAWREAGVSVLSVSVDGADTLRQLAQIAG